MRSLVATGNEREEEERGHGEGTAKGRASEREGEGELGPSAFAPGGPNRRARCVSRLKIASHPLMCLSRSSHSARLGIRSSKHHRTGPLGLLLGYLRYSAASPRLTSSLAGAIPLSCSVHILILLLLLLLHRPAHPCRQSKRRRGLFCPLLRPGGPTPSPIPIAADWLVALARPLRVLS